MTLIFFWSARFICLSIWGVKYAIGASSKIRGRDNITIGTWNTKTLRAAGKLQELTHKNEQVHMEHPWTLWNEMEELWRNSNRGTPGFPQWKRSCFFHVWSLNKVSSYLLTKQQTALLFHSFSPLSLTSKPSSKLSLFNRHLHKSRRTMVRACVGRGKLCLCLCVYLREWCVLAHWAFLTGRFVLCKSVRACVLACAHM